MSDILVLKHTMLMQEFNRQIQNLLGNGYPQIANVSSDEFVNNLEPLKEKLHELNGRIIEPGEGQIPFVIVIKSEFVSTEKAMALVDLKGINGYVGLYPVEANSFKPIESITLPMGYAYLLVDIDTGKKTLNVTPNDALTIISEENRSPLTIDEGVALLTHYPEVLVEHNCFYMSGSRRGDRRVTAMWISKGKPRLGWCWAGNPHTWLGTASCHSRVGA